MRIASISKCLTMMAVAKLWEEGKLDLDAPVQKYVPEFPEKVYEGEKVCNRLLVILFLIFVPVVAQPCVCRCLYRDQIL